MVSGPKADAVARAHGDAGALESLEALCERPPECRCQAARWEQRSRRWLRNNVGEPRAASLADQADGGVQHRSRLRRPEPFPKPYPLVNCADARGIDMPSKSASGKHRQASALPISSRSYDRSMAHFLLPSVPRKRASNQLTDRHARTLLAGPSGLVQCRSNYSDPIHSFLGNSRTDCGRSAAAHRPALAAPENVIFRRHAFFGAPLPISAKEPRKDYNSDSVASVVPPPPPTG